MKEKMDRLHSLKKKVDQQRPLSKELILELKNDFLTVLRKNSPPSSV